MKKIYLITLILLLSLPSLFSQTGVISFKNGHKLRFSKVEYLWTENRGIIVDYQGTERTIPISKLKRLSVIDFQRIDDTELIDARAEIETITGAVIQHTFKKLRYIGVWIYDELTGEDKIQIVYFAKDSDINILEIVFN